MAARKKRKNSTVRLNPNENVKITIEAPASALEQGLGSDLAMLAAQKGIPTVRPSERNPIFKKRAAARKKKTTKKKKPISRSEPMQVFGNPIHFPKTRAGRPAAEKWWIADLYDTKGKKFLTFIGKGAQTNARRDASRLIGTRQRASRGRGREVASLLLSGPYARKPTGKTKRK
jgi:hypothetical protein